jgi:hypothetical protein
MTWTFHARGHVGEDGQLHERELVKKLHELFSDDRYGRTTSEFTGSHVHAEVQGDGQASIAEGAFSVAAPQEPQRMDPPELQQPGPLKSLNPQKDPLMPIDTGNFVPPLDGGPSGVSADEHAKTLAGDQDDESTHDDPSQSHQDRQTDAQMKQDQKEAPSAGTNEGGSATQLGTAANPVHVQDDSK